MDNSEVPRIIYVSSIPAWLTLLLEDGLLEAEVAAMLGGSMVGATGRAIIWSVCEYFHCVKPGVPAQTCRVFERCIAHLLNNDVWVDEEVDLLTNMPQRLMLLMTCCFEIATNATSSTADVHPHEIRNFLESFGNQHTIAEILDMESLINRCIGYHVPRYNSLEMAELLADHLNVNRNLLDLIRLYIQLAELRRLEIETEVHLIASMHSITFCFPRVRSVHLAAGCVAAAVMIVCPETSNYLAHIFGNMLHVTSSYLTILRDVFLLLVLNPDPTL